MQKKMPLFWVSHLMIPIVSDSEKKIINPIQLQHMLDLLLAYCNYKGCNMTLVVRKSQMEIKKQCI
jgi:uncharacterized protein YutD